MSSLFLAAKGVGVVRDKLGLRAPNKYSPVLRWVGLGVAGVVLLVAVLSFFLPSDNPLLWAGIYGVIVALIVATFQSGIALVNRLLGFLLEVYYWRALVYVALSIGCYFAPILIVAGICLDLLAVAYIVVAYFFKERDLYDPASIAREEQKARDRERLQQNTAAPSLGNLVV